MKEGVKAGESAENSFPKAARNKGMETRPASRHEQRVEHIDFWMSPRGWRPNLQREKMTDKPKWSVEVKAMKRISRASPKPQSKWLWVEFKNVTGGPGWLYGSAVFIATVRRLLLTTSQDALELVSLHGRPRIQSF